MAQEAADKAEALAKAAADGTLPGNSAWGCTARLLLLLLLPWPTPP